MLWGNLNGSFFAIRTATADLSGDIDLAVSFVLARDGVFLNSVSDLSLLPAVLDAAERFEGAPDDEAVASLVERARLTPLFVS